MTGGAPAPKLHVPVPVWVPILSWLAVLGALVLLAWMMRGWWRRRHRPKITDSEASRRRWVSWVSSRWLWDAVNLGLVLVDDTTRHRREWWSGRTLPPLTVRVPQIRFETAPCGLRAWMRTLPGVGLDQVTKMADHLANAWGCLRVDVTQHSPGLLLLRGFVNDPLAEAWHVTPNGQPLADWQLHVGIDDEANHVILPLANLSGVTIAGVPGTGKTSLQRWWLCQLAPHPAVQTAVLDGKVSDPADGDYGLLLPRCFAAAGDDCGRPTTSWSSCGRPCGPVPPGCEPSEVLRSSGTSAPPSTAPWSLVIVDESHTFVTGASRKDRELCESNVWYLTKLAKEGRSRGFLTVFVTQKQTADAIPTAIRDVCQVGISFGVRTMDGAVAALGDDIRQYPDLAPTLLIGREWTGVAVMRLPDRAGYHRVRTPHVTETDAAQLIEAYAGLRQAPHILQVVSDDQAVEEMAR